MKVNFQEVATKRTKRIRCQVCGKTHQKTMKFWQTISPFNNKTADQIRHEITTEAAAWMAQPLPCSTKQAAA